MLAWKQPRLHQTAFSVPPPSAWNSSRKLLEELVSFSFFSWAWQLRTNDQKAIAACQNFTFRFPPVVFVACSASNTCWTLVKKNSKRFSKMSSESLSSVRQLLLPCLIGFWLEWLFPPSGVRDPCEKAPELKDLWGTWRFEQPSQPPFPFKASVCLFRSFFISWRTNCWSRQYNCRPFSKPLATALAKSG